ncbi:DUF1822 family protein [Okeania sp. SIO2B3]|uniref:DUF1822 family protein n=1 Tax=Okeania sp. SIO2B3 TaxID=2607784 RepID=UPI0013C0DFBC|nr:DUF1822 family protein [Okeania sp. SIO2B3]NET45929.1 DUF1822 family protein [Okeania sp. SIO2B3]
MNNLTFAVLLTPLAHEFAERFQKLQTNPLKAQQVYRNTLAVYAGDYYFGCSGVTTDLEGSDSWNPIIQTLANTGELIVKNKGSLECRPVMAGSKFFHVPAEVWADRIGYVVVELNSDLTEAKLLGYLPSVESEEVSLEKLQPIDDLVDDLMGLKPYVVPDTAVQLQPQVVPQTFVQLGQWLQNQFEEGWETLESILDNTNLSPAFRTRYAYRTRNETLEQPKPTVEMVKLLGSEFRLAGNLIALLVGLTLTTSNQLNVSVEVSPTQEPEGNFQELEAMVLDETGKRVMGATATETQEINFTFIGEPGDRFSVRVILDDICLTENFVI